MFRSYTPRDRKQSAPEHRAAYVHHAFMHHVARPRKRRACIFASPKFCFCSLGTRFCARRLFYCVSVLVCVFICALWALWSQRNACGFLSSCDHLECTFKRFNCKRTRSLRRCIYTYCNMYLVRITFGHDCAPHRLNNMADG